MRQPSNETGAENLFFYICVPVYRTEQYIDRCIQSVLDQSYRNFCLILVDDGSPDNCGSICDAYAGTDERIVVLHQENKGLIAARRAAISVVLEKSDILRHFAYVVCLDSDDVLMEHALQILADRIRQYPCDLLIYNMKRITPDERILPAKRSDTPPRIVTDKGELYKLVLTNAAYNSLCRKAVSVGLLSHKDFSRYYHIRHGEDLLQSLEYYQNCRKAVFTDDVLYGYTVNPQSITHSVSYDTYTVDSTLRSEVLRFVKAEAVWNQKDFEEYLTYCRKILQEQIETAADFRTTLNNRIDLLEKLACDPYHAVLLEKAGKGELSLQLLKRRKYRCVVYVNRIKSHVLQIYRVLFKRRNRCGQKKRY